MKYFKIYRWDPEVAGQKPYMATYAINLKECVSAAEDADAFCPRSNDPFILIRSPQMWPNDARCFDEN
jgi:succinate dehydrogenase (ubiquinone) iron-sulfur subunit